MTTDQKDAEDKRHSASNTDAARNMVSARNSDAANNSVSAKNMVSARNSDAARNPGAEHNRDSARNPDATINSDAANNSVSANNTVSARNSDAARNPGAEHNRDSARNPVSASNPDAARNSGAAADGVRLQKVMASAGVASRRGSEDLITAGRVRVNGKVVTELGRRIHPETDQVAVDNVAVQLDTTRLYLMLNKPVGVVSSMQDESGRPDLREFTDQFEERVFNVGRLDAMTSGLLILTNDGDLAHVLAHPSFGVSKTYIAKVEGRVSAQTIGRLQSGIELDDGPIAADKARILTSPPGDGFSLVELTLHSGRNRIVRRMLEAVGHPVVDLVRRQFGPLHLGTLRVGAVRDLTKVELGQLLTVSRTERATQSEPPK